VPFRGYGNAPARRAEHHPRSRKGRRRARSLPLGDSPKRSRAGRGPRGRAATADASPACAADPRMPPQRAAAARRLALTRLRGAPARAQKRTPAPPPEREPDTSHPPTQLARHTASLPSPPSKHRCHGHRSPTVEIRPAMATFLPTWGSRARRRSRGTGDGRPPRCPVPDPRRLRGARHPPLPSGEQWPDHAGTPVRETPGKHEGKEKRWPKPVAKNRWPEIIDRVSRPAVVLFIRPCPSIRPVLQPGGSRTVGSFLVRPFGVWRRHAVCRTKGCLLGLVDTDH